MDTSYINNYTIKLKSALNSLATLEAIPLLAEAMKKTWVNGNSIFICGNGGSAGNAVHMANDFLYGAGVKNGKGLRVEALSANTAVITCLGNDLGYDQIYSEQVKVKGNPGDILIVLSGSGNSSNVVKAIEVANSIKMKTFAILGYDGGKCKDLADVSIHFDINDMQIAEDLQLIVGHMCMQWLCEQKL